MVTLDTNVVVRALIEPDDQPEQGVQARALVAAAFRSGEQIYIPDVVLVETGWVLRKVVKLSKDEISALFLPLLQNSLFVFDDVDLLVRAITVWKAHPGDLADFIIGELAAARSATPVYTFDVALHRNARFKGPAGGLGVLP